MHAGALRGAAAARYRHAAERAGLRLVQVGTGTLRSSQLFGDFLAPTDNALDDRELAPALQQGASLPSAGAGAARRRRGNRGPDAGAGDSQHVPQLCVGLAARRRSTSAVGDRRPRRRSERARAALSGLDRVQRPGAGRGASGHGAVRHRRRAAAAARRRRGGRLLFAFAVLAREGCGAISRRRGAVHVVRRPALAAAALDRDRERDRCRGRGRRRLARRPRRRAFARPGGRPVGPVLRESALSPAGLAIAAGVVVLATLVIAAATSMPAREESRFGLLDAAALARARARRCGPRSVAPPTSPGSPRRERRPRPAPPARA